MPLLSAMKPSRSTNRLVNSVGKPMISEYAAQVMGLTAHEATHSSVPKLSNVKQPTGPGAGAPTHKRTARGKSGWGDAKGWAKNAKGGSGKAGKGWTDSGGWPKAAGWSGKSKAWASSGGGAWARPGNKS